MEAAARSVELMWQDSGLKKAPSEEEPGTPISYNASSNAMHLDALL